MSGASPHTGNTGALGLYRYRFLEVGLLRGDLELDLEEEDRSSSGSGRTLDANHMIIAYVIPVETPITAQANNGCEGPR
jgi:hypothetical protein